MFFFLQLPRFKGQISMFHSLVAFFASFPERRNNFRRIIRSENRCFERFYKSLFLFLYIYVFLPKRREIKNANGRNRELILLMPGHFFDSFV